MDDLVKLRYSHDEALRSLRRWQGASVQLSGPGDIQGITAPPDELAIRLNILQHHLISRIGLARKARAFAIQPIGSGSKCLITEAGVAKAIAAFSDPGLRLEFDSHPLSHSLAFYLGTSDRESQLQPES